MANAEYILVHISQMAFAYRSFKEVYLAFVNIEKNGV